jgi:hypothetical protein
VYWSALLDALEKPLSKETLAEVVDIDGLREHWKRVVEGSNVAQAYLVVTEEGQLKARQARERLALGAETGPWEYVLT